MSISGEVECFHLAVSVVVIDVVIRLVCFMIFQYANTQTLEQWLVKSNQVNPQSVL